MTTQKKMDITSEISKETKMNTPTAELIDDGTLDTVIQVNEKTYRYNFDGGDFDDGDNVQTYDDFVEWCLKDAEEQYQDELNEVK